MKILLFSESHGDADGTNSSAELQNCYGAARVLPVAVRFISDICSLQEGHWPVSTRAGFFLQSKTWKLLSLINSCTCKATHSIGWSFIHILGSSSSRSCLFMPLYVDAFGLSHKTENTLKSVSFIWACRQHYSSANINQIKGSFQPGVRSSS